MIISKTPLRVSIVGGGTDMSQFYHNSKGQVISFAIDKYIYVTVKERFDDLIVLNYTQHEVVGSVDEIKHDLIRECCKITGITKSIEISTIADIFILVSPIIGLISFSSQKRHLPIPSGLIMDFEAL